MIIALEGIDACGKATQAKLLAERFNQNIRDTQCAKVLAFPHYESNTGRVIKHMLENPGLMHRFAFESLQLTNKLEAVNEIESRELQNRITILDRWTASAVVYGMAHGTEEAWICCINKVLPKPDVHILIDIPVETSFSRRQERRDAWEEDRLFMLHVRATYHSVWGSFRAPFRELGRCWAVINGSLSAEQVHDLIWQEVISLPRRI